MTGNELRKAFLDFFESKGHLILPSASLVPKDDPTLLWINAGMAPLKPYFDGRAVPPKRRISTAQKCIRTNDIENVGRTARHHTFFEMLGNFSFGDYFKEDAIKWAWEFVTEVLEMPEERLWVTIHPEDEEAFKIWHEQVGLSAEKILRDEENFWEIGTGTGPCGPCTEIHYDRGPEFGCGKPDCGVLCDCDRYLEVWNLVFTQYNQTEDGKYLPLPQKNIDTGMGLERVASILQGVNSNYETDLVKPVIDKVYEMTGIDYNKDEQVRTAYRVIADHIRAITFAVSDGAMPSNEGRGYVIRRILRRAVRWGRILGITEPFLYKLVPVVVNMMEEGYPELKEREEHVVRIVQTEEERFQETLDQGLHILSQMMAEQKKAGSNEITGEQAFKLYDTYGFPLDLTQDIAQEEGFTVDVDGFKAAMEEQRERARAAREEYGFGDAAAEVYKKIREEKGIPEFSGYSSLEEETEVIALVKDGRLVDSLSAGEEGQVVLKKTPFYAESGGQVGDTGRLEGEGITVTVTNTRKLAEVNFSEVLVEDGNLRVGMKVKAVVEEVLRKDTARNHSATHILHKALKEILGDHVNQAGSLVEPTRLRFDFTHYQALTDDELKAIEEKVNEEIRKNHPIETTVTTLEKAKEMGAIALFDEKYGSDVRVVSIGDYSMELCGGTHLKASGEIGLFKIVSETGIAAGTRRIEALTGRHALDYVTRRETILKEAAEIVKAKPDELVERLERLVVEIKEKDKEIDALKQKLAGSQVDEILNQVKEINGVKFLGARVEGIDASALRNMGDELKQRLGSGVIVLASDMKGKVLFVAMVTDDLTKRFHAGKIIGEVARITGGGGGGRPNMAQAGGKNPAKISEALKKAEEIVMQG
ncbi:alanine--tRNA ligase [Anoxybacter fermentans]|uniref:Alanine--tRNA ligase n=1 Tax=Anoxybacter fermentans TaxID=1323375 RepID=A0A3Q9HUW6_9FIRM|nr:alanine--tRNA ligase [Anoxybacter fermentans]